MYSHMYTLLYLKDYAYPIICKTQGSLSGYSLCTLYLKALALHHVTFSTKACHVTLQLRLSSIIIFLNLYL